MHTALAVLLIGVACSAAASSVPPRIEVDRKEPGVEVRVFDLSFPPADLPPFRPGWAAATVCYFSCQPELQVDEQVGAMDVAGCHLRSSVSTVHLALALRVVTWLPSNANGRIAEHEEGHRGICLRVYEDAVSAGFEAADEVAGRVFEARRESCCQASEWAVEGEAIDTLRGRYDQQVADAARQAGEFFDWITHDGRGIDPPARLAMTGAIHWYEESYSRKRTEPECDSGRIATEPRQARLTHEMVDWLGSGGVTALTSTRPGVSPGE